MRTAKTDQTGRMTRLIWVFSGYTGHFVGFVMHRLICNLGESNERARFSVRLGSLGSFVCIFFFLFFFIIYI